MNHHKVIAPKNLYKKILFKKASRSWKFFCWGCIQPVTAGGLGLPRITEVLNAQWAQMWTVAYDGGDHWRDELVARGGGQSGWEPIDWAGASPTMKVLLKSCNIQDQVCHERKQLPGSTNTSWGFQKLTKRAFSNTNRQRRCDYKRRYHKQHSHKRSRKRNWRTNLPQ